MRMWSMGCVGTRIGFDLIPHHPLFLRGWEEYGNGVEEVDLSV